MARGKALRHITKEQFSEGTSIDGTRLDRAMEDLERHTNRMPPKSVRSRFVQQQYVYGWQPQTADAEVNLDHRFPFLRVINNDNQWFDSPAPASQNKWRAKGTFVPGIKDDGDPIIGSDHAQWLWQNQFRASKPMILQDLMVLMLRDHCTYYDFDGVDDYMENAGGHTTPVTSDGFSMTVRARFTPLLGGGTQERWVFSVNDGTTGNIAGIRRRKTGGSSSPGSWEGVVDAPSGSDLVIGTLVELYRWYHLTLVVTDPATNPGTIEFFIDGVSVGTASADFTGISHDTVTFGSDPGGNPDFADADVQWAAFWDRALTAAEVAQLAAATRNLKQDALDYVSSSRLQSWWVFGEAPGDTSVLIEDQQGSVDLSIFSSPSLESCGIYQNYFRYESQGVNPGSPIAEKEDEPSDDWSVQIAISDDTDPEFRKSDIIEINKWQTSARVWSVTGSPNETPSRATWLDMEPPHPGGIPCGIYLHLRDMNIPVPEGARVRIGLCLPGYDQDTITNGWNTNTEANATDDVATTLATQNQAYSMCLTTLEELEEGGREPMLRKERKRLPRGARLNPDMIFANVLATDEATYDDIVTDLNGADVQSEQLERNRVPFRVNLNIPYIDGRFVDGIELAVSGTAEDLEDNAYLVPFTLPPLQEFWDDNGAVGPGVPIPVLDELSLSFDTRGEHGHITSSHDGVGGGPEFLFGNANLTDEGKLKQSEADRLTVKLRIYEKLPTRFAVDVLGDDASQDPTGQSLLMDTEVVSFEIDPISLVGPKERIGNPFLLTDINKPLDPYKTYVCAFFVRGLIKPGTEDRMALVNIQLTLRGTVSLVAKDSGAQVQNLPTVHGGLNSGAGLTAITPPAFGDEIQAEGAQGISEQYSNIDEHLRKGLKGGYTWWSDEPPQGAELAEDSGYQVIAVPMFGNLPMGEANLQSIGVSPYAGIIPGPTNGGAFPLVDRRLIPLVYPFTVHHVLAVVNYQSWQPLGAGFVTGDLTHKIGVGVMTGMAGDNVGYQQVAYLDAVQEQLSGTPWVDDHLIDRIKNPITIDNQVAACDLISVPLVEITGQSGDGYPTSQGKPFFAGRALTPTFGRQNVGGIGGAVGAASAIAGTEHFLEVRWSIQPNDEWLLIPPTSPIFVGYGGNWVYLIGKNQLV